MQLSPARPRGAMPGSVRAETRGATNLRQTRVHFLEHQIGRHDPERHAHHVHERVRQHLVPRVDRAACGRGKASDRGFGGAQQRRTRAPLMSYLCALAKRCSLTCFFGEPCGCGRAAAGADCGVSAPAGAAARAAACLRGGMPHAARRSACVLTLTWISAPNDARPRQTRSAKAYVVRPTSRARESSGVRPPNPFSRYICGQ